MPAADCFLDTNVLLYSISTVPTEVAKASVAQHLIANRNWAWSGQVAAEFASASASRKRAVLLPPAAIEYYLNLWLAFPMIAVDAALVLEAVRLASRYGINHYDAQILAAAKRMGCATVFTEDLNHGQLYDGVLVENPFLALPGSTAGS